MKMGSPMILTCMNRILQNPQKIDKHIYRYEGNTDPEMKQLFMVSNPNQEKGVFVAGFAANSISDAAQVLINISIKTE
jgi:hypothetical protein